MAANLTKANSQLRQLSKLNFNEVIPSAVRGQG